MARLLTLLLVLTAVFAGSPATAGEETLQLSASHEQAAPGDTVILSLSGAAPRTRLALFVSMDNTPFQLGPFDTRCGLVEFQLDLTPRRRLGGSRHMRPDDQGNAFAEFRLPERLPSHFDGQTFYFQAVSMEFQVDQQSLDCSFSVCTSNLESTLVSLP